MRERVLADAGAVARQAADLIAETLRAGGSCVLAGGTTPQACYGLLRPESLPWGRVSILFSDERCVAPDDPESNYRLAREALLSRVAPLSVHRIPGELGAEPAAGLYSEIVTALRPLDLVLLGVGEDGHTASLFPGNPALHAGGSAVAVHGAPKPPPSRVSLTLEVLREARRVLVLATGHGKREAVAQARRGTVPSGMIPHAEWLLDLAAAGA
jgi:6-phosphogluconolactonase